MMKPQDPGVHRLPESVSPVPSINQETPTHSQVESSRPDPWPVLQTTLVLTSPLALFQHRSDPAGIPASRTSSGREDPAYQVHVTWPSPSSHWGWILVHPGLPGPLSVPSSRAGLSNSPASFPPCTPTPNGSFGV